MPMTRVLVSQRRRRFETQRHTEKKVMGQQGSRDWRDAATIQGTPWAAVSNQKLGETDGRNFPPEAPEGNDPATKQHLDFRLLTSRIVREYISLGLKSPVCGNLL